MDVVSVLPTYIEVLFGRLPVEEGLPLEHLIPRAELDYSVASLHAIDGYLAELHANTAEIPEQQVINVATAVGAYIGEVIRRNAQSRQYEWLNHGEYFSKHPKTAGIFPFGPGTAALLAGDDGSMTLPINKVLRFIYEGPENNIHFYASSAVR
jgi:hypothetical protein